MIVSIGGSGFERLPVEEQPVNKTRIEAICERWLTAMEKDGPNAKRPPKFLGDSDQITFFHKKCQDFIINSASGQTQKTKAEFIEEMRTAGQAEFVNQHDFGKRYKSFVEEHTFNVNPVLLEMHDAFTGISSDFLKDTDIPSLADNIKKLAFVTQVSRDLEECRDEEVLVASYDEDENTNEMDEKEQRTAEIRELDIFMKYCNYIASDNYTLDRDANEDEMKAIYDAYWAKTQMDAIAEKISKAESIGATADEMKTYNVGDSVKKQEEQFKEKMKGLDNRSKEWVDKANAFIASGENPLTIEKDEAVMEAPKANDLVQGEATVGESVKAAEEPAIEEPAIEEPVIEEPAIEEPVIGEPAIEEPVIDEPEVKESTVDWKEWMDFDTFDMVETGELDEEGKAIKAVDEKSIRTMTWKDLLEEDNKEKGVNKKFPKTERTKEAEKDTKKEKQKEVPVFKKGGKS